MSQPTYPAQQPGFPPPASKRRPRVLWLVVAAVLVLLGAGLFVGGFVVLGQAIFHTDAAVARDGQPHELTLDDTDRRILWRETLAPPATCTVTDTASGQDLPVTPPTASYTRSLNGPQQVGSGTFQPTSTQVTVTCDAAGGGLEVGRSPGATTFGWMLAGVLGGVALGGIGLLWLIVLLVLFFTWLKRA